MAKFSQSFRFEQSAVPLEDRTFFRPLVQGVDRWVVSIESGFDAAPGYSFQILYEHADGSFIIVEYGLCESREPGGRILIGSSPPRAGRITQEQALNFILNNQFA